MQRQTASYNIGAILLFAAALASSALAIYAYVTPLTGVSGTLGALIVIVTSIILAVAALVLPAISPRGWRNLWRILILLGLIGICFAGILLHRWWIGVAMVIGLIGLIIDMTGRTRAATPIRTKG